MMKKILLVLILLTGTLSASAQFEKGKKHLSTALTGLNLQYSGEQKFRFGLDANAGYFIDDCLMLRAQVGYNHTKESDDFNFGVGARYYFDQCGVFLGAGATYIHETKGDKDVDFKRNDFAIPVEVGYAFFINKHLTIEPAAYYQMSIDDFSNKSTVGLKVGLGFYF